MASEGTHGKRRQRRVGAVGDAYLAAKAAQSKRAAEAMRRIAGAGL